jgi:hypothetical protein
MLAIQIVKVGWSKRGRGGAAATERNRIPREFPLEPHGGSLNVIARHIFFEVEVGKFVAETSTGQAPQLPSNNEGLLLEECEGKLLVGFAWDFNRHGMPERRRKRRAAVLLPGETAQMRLNGRHGGYAHHGHHWYTQHTFNVAYGADLTENIFARGAFDHSISFEDQLY